MPFNSGLVGQAEQEFDIYQNFKPTGNADMGKDAFLQLLVAQLTHQDPMNPMEDKEFTSQLAEFSSLEQLTNISDGISGLTEATNRQELLGAVSFIGKDIKAQGNTLSITEEGVTKLYYDLPESIASGFVNIFDPNGNMVETIEIGAKQAGSYTLEWDGTDYNGNKLPQGVYNTTMAAETAEGKQVMVYTDVSGTITGVQNFGDTFYLTLDDGRVLDLMNIKEIVDPIGVENEEAQE